MLLPPDDDDPPTPSDMAESVTMEEDEVEWQKWLSDLFDPNSKCKGCASVHLSIILPNNTARITFH